jgi:hypothetical protein
VQATSYIGRLRPLATAFTYRKVQRRKGAAATGGSA